MSKPIATAIFAGPYGGEETRAVTQRANTFRIQPPGYVAKAFSTPEAAERYAERAHNFIRWAA